MLKTKSNHAPAVLRLALLTWIALAGCATEPAALSGPAPVRPPAGVASTDLVLPPAVGAAQVGPEPWDGFVRLYQLKHAAFESEVRMFDLQRRLDQMDEGSCAFYWDPNNRPLPPNRETSPGLSKDNLDRLAKEIGDVRADIADPADRAAFDRDVTEPFRRARAKFEEATTR